MVSFHREQINVCPVCPTNSSISMGQTILGTGYLAARDNVKNFVSADKQQHFISVVDYIIHDRDQSESSPHQCIEPFF